MKKFFKIVVTCFVLMITTNSYGSGLEMAKMLLIPKVVEKISKADEIFSSNIKSLKVREARGPDFLDLLDKGIRCSKVETYEITVMGYLAKAPYFESKPVECKIRVFFGSIEDCDPTKEIQVTDPICE